MKRTRWLAVVVLGVAMVAASCGRRGSAQSSPTTRPPATNAGVDCSSVTPQATEVGVTADTITIETMADVGSPLSPGLFQANLDAVKAFADHVNSQGGIACRKLVVRTWDTKLTPDEAKNGQLDACDKAIALVGGNSLFNPDVTTQQTCPDKTGAPTGIPDLAALANDINEQCASTTYNIQIAVETCPVTPGQPRPIKSFVGPEVKVFLPQNPGLHGMFAVPGDLPTTVQSAMSQVDAQSQAGVKWDDVVKVGGRDEQAAFLPRVVSIKDHASTYYYNGSGQNSLVLMRREAAAQGADSVKVWACSLGCYSQQFLSTGGADVEGTYVWMQFLPFEEADTNPELAAYLKGVGADKATSFGAQAWQASVLLETAINDVVQKYGVNGITRAHLLEALDGIHDFTANGWMGAKDLKGVSDCFVLLQVHNGKFVRVYPTERGTFDCDPKNVATVTIDPAAEAATLK